jgi:heme-degrading monooxygenase HmoA
VELLVVSRWQSMAAIKAFAGANPDRAVVEPGAKALLLEFDDFVTHYEVTLEAMGA